MATEKGNVMQVKIEGYIRAEIGQGISHVTRGEFVPLTVNAVSVKHALEKACRTLWAHPTAKAWLDLGLDSVEVEAVVATDSARVNRKLQTWQLERQRGNVLFTHNGGGY